MASKNASNKKEVAPKESAGLRGVVSKNIRIDSQGFVGGFAGSYLNGPLPKWA